MRKKRLSIFTNKIAAIFLAVGLVVFPNVATVQAADLPGYVPMLANWIPQSGGYTVSLLGYDGSFQWTFSSSSGQVQFNSSVQTITVTGAAPLQMATLNVGTSKSGFTSESAQISGNVLGLNWNYTPSMQLVSQTADGFITQIANFDASIFWSLSATAGKATLGNTGLITVKNLNRGQSTTVTLNMNRFGYATLFATYMQSALPPPLTLIPKMGLMKISGNSILFPVTNFDNYFDWKVTTSLGSAAIDTVSGLVTVTGLTGNQIAKVLVTDFHSGQVIGQTTFLAYLYSSSLILKPAFGTAVADLKGFEVSVTNFDPVFDWTVSADVGSASIDSAGLISVTGMEPGQTSLLTVSSIIDGASASTSTLKVADWPAKGLDLTLSAPNRTGDGFNFQITDYNRFYDYSAESDFGLVSISRGGLGLVSGLIPGRKALVKITVGKNGQVINTSEISSSAYLDLQVAPVAPPIPKTTATPKATSTPKATQKPKPIATPVKTTAAPRKTPPKKKAVVTVRVPSPVAKKKSVTLVCLRGLVHKYVTSPSPTCPPGFTKQK